MTNLSNLTLPSLRFCSFSNAENRQVKIKYVEARMNRDLHKAVLFCWQRHRRRNNRSRNSLENTDIPLFFWILPLPAKHSRSSFQNTEVFNNKQSHWPKWSKPCKELFSYQVKCKDLVNSSTLLQKHSSVLVTELDTPSILKYKNYLERWVCS